MKRTRMRGQRRQLRADLSWLVQVRALMRKISREIDVIESNLMKQPGSLARIRPDPFPADVRSSSGANRRMLQVLKTEQLRPMRVHLRTGRRFVIKPTDYVLGNQDGFIVSRPQAKGAPVYVEKVPCSEVVMIDLKLKWRLSVIRAGALPAQ